LQSGAQAEEAADVWAARRHLPVGALVGGGS
jgi:hypothetical protein